MIKIPKTINIGETKYKIKHKGYYFDDNIGGNINYNTNKIGIRKSLDTKNKESTFFHEIAHGVLKELEFNYPKSVAFRNNENFVQEMGLILRKTFIDLLDKQSSKTPQTKEGEK